MSLMHERISHAEMAFELEKLIYGKTMWLKSCASGKSKRPDHEIEARRREKHVLEQAAFDYRRAAERVAKKAETGTVSQAKHPVSAGENRRVDARQNLHSEQQEFARNA